MTYQVKFGKISYEGPFFEDKPHGLGEELYMTKNGSRKFTGTFKNGHRNGFGELIGKEYSYKGEWFTNVKHGFGIESYSPSEKE